MYNMHTHALTVNDPLPITLFTVQLLSIWSKFHTEKKHNISVTLNMSTNLPSIASKHLTEAMSAIMILVSHTFVPYLVTPSATQAHLHVISL